MAMHFLNAVRVISLSFNPIWMTMWSLGPNQKEKSYTMWCNVLNTGCSLQPSGLRLKWWYLVHTTNTSLLKANEAKSCECGEFEIVSPVHRVVIRATHCIRNFNERKRVQCCSNTGCFPGFSLSTFLNNMDMKRLLGDAICLGQKLPRSWSSTRALICVKLFSWPA